MYISATILYRYVFSKYCPLVCSFSFYSPDSFFSRAENFNFYDVQLIIFFLSWIMPLVLYLESAYQTQAHLYFSYLSSRGFIISHFTLRFVIILIVIKVQGPCPVFCLFLIFARGCPYGSAPCVEKTVFALLYYLCSFVTN